MKKRVKSQQFKADMGLLLVTLGWGASYALMRVALSDMQPMTLNAFRFLFAFIVAYVLAFKRMRNISKETIKFSIYIAISLFAVYTGCTYGVLYTSISNVGFLCALPVLFTPILAYIFKKQVPSRKFVAVVIMCVIGIALLSLNEEFKFAIGDLICIGAAFAYSIDLLLTETAVAKEEVDAFHLGVMQLLMTGILCLIVALFTEDVSLPQSPQVWGSVIFLSIFCTGVAFIVQAIAQQYTTASHVGVIFTLEPVFSGIVAFVFFHEVLSGRAYFGAVLLIVSMFLMEIELPWERKKRLREQGKVKK